MNWGWLSLNLAYVIYAGSGLFKEMLRLRVTLLVATMLFIVYGIVSGVWSVFWWNLPVALVHAWQIWLLLKQRRGIDLNAEAEAIRTLLYPGLDRVTFNRFWHASREATFTDDVLTVKAKPVHYLYLILDGEVDVEVRDDHTIRLGRLRMVGEMSEVTGDVATATVRTVGEIRARVWDKQELAALVNELPELERAHLRALGTELTRKLS